MLLQVIYQINKFRCNNEYLTNKDWKNVLYDTLDNIKCMFTYMLMIIIIYKNNLFYMYNLRKKEITDLR